MTVAVTNHLDFRGEARVAPERLVLARAVPGR